MYESQRTGNAAESNKGLFVGVWGDDEGKNSEV